MDVVQIGHDAQAKSAKFVGRRQEHLRDAPLRRLILTRQAALKRVCDKLDRRLAELIAGHDDLVDLHNRLRSVPGVGPVLATTLIALLSELGSLTRRQVAALVGVAPFDRSSGQRSAPKSLHAWRATVRKALYMAALSASRWNSDITAFAARLASKPAKIRIVACMRKLIVALNAIVRDDAQWQPRIA